MLLTFVCGLQTKGFAASIPEDSNTFFLVTSDTVTEAPRFSDEEFYRLSTSVVFKVNSTLVSPGDAFFRLYREEILPSVNARHLQLRKIYIRGAASPEGPYANNQRLSRGRSEALLRELKRELTYQYLDAEVDVNSVTEDYGYLCVLMQRAGDRDYAVVRGIYDECGADELCCKERLMKYDRGALWRRLLKEYFPQLRAARLILWFSEPDEEHAPPAIVDFRPEATSDSVTGHVTSPAFVYTPLPVYASAAESVAEGRRHVVAVRTNLVHDCFVMPGFGFAPSPNVQLEFYPLSGHLTYNVGLTWGTLRHWKTHEFWQVRDVQAELRRYFRGHGDFLGFYLGAYAHGGKYGIGIDEEKGWQGEYGGAGLAGGYTLPLTKKGNFRLELTAALGVIGSRFDPYTYGNPVTGTIDGDYYYKYYGSASDFKRRNHQAFYWGPTNLGIQLTYDIIYRKMPPKRHRR